MVTIADVNEILERRPQEITLRSPDGSHVKCITLRRISRDDKECLQLFCETKAGEQEEYAELSAGTRMFFLVTDDPLSEGKYVINGPWEVDPQSLDLDVLTN